MCVFFLVVNCAVCACCGHDMHMHMPWSTYNFDQTVFACTISVHDDEKYPFSEYKNKMEKL